MIDYIVIGAGSAGCVLAARLSGLSGARVLLLEAGTWDSNPAIHDPLRMHELWGGNQDWALETVPQPHAAGRRLPLPRGKVVGGSHALNAMIYVRGNPADYDGWGQPGWSWADVEPVFRRIESGPLTILRDFEPDPIQRDILAATKESGLPVNPDYNGADQRGASLMQFTIRNGKRLTTAGAYLRPALDNLTVITSAEVRRLLLRGNRCVGVEWERDGVLDSAQATEVILAAGAIGSPRILLRSGIGPADELRAQGIDPVLDLPEVGRNLVDHWLVPTIFSATRPITHTPGLPHSQTHLFWDSRPGLPVPDLQPLHFSVPLYEPWMSGPANGFSLMAGLIRPASHGSVTLSGIDPRVLSAESDIRALAEAVRLCREIGNSAALADWGVTEQYPGDADLTDYIRRTVITYHHQAGTCAMGTVVDPELRVLGIDGLRVADASVMPTITTGNTNAPTIMIAEMLAARVHGVQNGVLIDGGTRQLGTDSAAVEDDYPVTNGG